MLKFSKSCLSHIASLSPGIVRILTLLIFKYMFMMSSLINEQLIDYVYIQDYDNTCILVKTNMINDYITHMEAWSTR